MVYGLASEPAGYSGVENSADLRDVAVVVFLCLEVGLHAVDDRSVTRQHKKLSYRRGTARCVVSVEILSIATQQCRNYLYDKS